MKAVGAKEKRSGLSVSIRKGKRKEWLVSVEYTGMLDGDNEVTQGPLVDGWVGAYENYTFDEENGSTALTVDVDVHDTMQDYFKDTFPKALNKLREICEA
jgi:hypothetical protein